MNEHLEAIGPGAPCVDCDNDKLRTEFERRLGDAVIAVIVQALMRGQADGSIRKDIGNPAQVCVMLWAFTHGLIQIATNKTQEIARLGVEVSQLMEGSFAMLRYMLAAKPAG